MRETITAIILVYLLIMTIVGLVVMKADKVKAGSGAWRIRESTLFLISIIGGSLGTWAGMNLFRHKTKHWYFVIGMPLIAVIHCLLIIYLFSRGILAL